MHIYSIYKITNTNNQKVYIGFTMDFERRMNQHRWAHKIKNLHLYYAMRQYGYDTFSYEIIYQSKDFDYCKNIMESYFITLYDSYNNGYNMTNGGDGTIGRYWTDEEKRISSERQKGKISPYKGKTYEEIHGIEKAAEKIKKFKESIAITLALKPKKEKSKKQPYGKARVGMTYEDLFGEEKAKEIKAKHRANVTGEKNPRYGKPGTFTGKTHAKETLEKRRKSYEEQYGEERAAELKKKCSENNAGANNPMYGKVGAMKGKTHSVEARAKMSAARKGKKHTPRKILICPHCEKASDSSNAKRWHFDNCKLKK